jgi:hypothetical protein
MSENDRYYHFRKRKDRTYVSPQQQSFGGRKTRIVSKVIDSTLEGVMEIARGDQITLRRTPKGPQESMQVRMAKRRAGGRARLPLSPKPST